MWRKRIHWRHTIRYVQKRTKQKTKEERTSAVRQLFHYSECKIKRYYTNHSDGLPAKNCADYTVDTLVSTTYITGVSTAKSER